MSRCFDRKRRRTHDSAGRSREGEEGTSAAALLAASSVYQLVYHFAISSVPCGCAPVRDAWPAVGLTVCVRARA